MRGFVALSLPLLMLLASPTQAQVTGQDTEPVVAESPEARLDRMFSELRRSANEQAARRIADNIRREWLRSGSASIDLLMQWAEEAMKGDRNPAALDFLDQIVTLAPGFAEGWNRRATLHFTMGNHAKAMADIGRTLQLEPRHFGALSGMAMILDQGGRDEGAMRAYERVLEVYPMLRNAQSELGRLADELSGQGI